VGIGLLYLSLREVDWRLLAQHLAAVRLSWLAAALASILLTTLFKVLRWRSLMRALAAGETPGLLRLSGAFVVGQAANILLPFRGGDVARVGWLALEERRRLVEEQVIAEDWAGVSCLPEQAALADVMVEAAVGSLPVPLGLAAGFLVDGRELAVPMAVEEPSVIAAASYAARLIRRGGGFTTWASEPVMRAQIFLEKVPPGGELRVAPREAELRERLDVLQASLRARGGGFCGLEVARLPETGLVRVDLLIDVRDAMGANILNTAAEHLRPRLEELTGGRALMGILSNAARERRAGARFALPLEHLRVAGADAGGAAGQGTGEASASRAAASQLPAAMGCSA
jgi:hypothetical protein